MDKPLLIFDGDCGFCRRWIVRWKALTGDKVAYAASQDAAKDFPDIPPDEFQKAVLLIEPDGRRSSAAHAVFRTLSYAGKPSWLWAYQKLPGFAPVSEAIYGIVSGHRPAFSAFTRWLWGAPAEPSAYRQTRWLFLRALGLVYAVAFGSYGVQIRGLNGSQGILPAREFLGQLMRYGATKFWLVPTLAWLNSNDSFLVGLCAAGVIFSVFLILNLAPRLSLFSLWLLYLSIMSIGGDFMNFQWDALLLETGFLAIFFAPSGFLPQVQGVAPPSRPILFLLRWLLFRLMFQSALVKWFSGDPLWHHFTALAVHYQTQPLPNMLAWYANRLPLSLQKLSCMIMFVIEGFVPFLIFAPRRARLFAFWALAGFQGLILLTGNYAFFNWLTIALCILLLDDVVVKRWLRSWSAEPMIHSGWAELSSSSWRKPGSRRLWDWVPTFVGVTATGSVLFLTSVPFARVLGIALPAWVVAPAEMASPLRSFNSYGLFAVMTPERMEINLEGSNDRKNWQPYAFKYKPGDPARRPSQVAPYQPRLDWQMWFAALGDYRQNPWFIHLCVRILQGSPPVLALLAKDPFPGQSPRYLRAILYEYRFTTPAERRRTGNWWVREVKGLYCPVMSLGKR